MSNADFARPDDHEMDVRGGQRILDLRQRLVRQRADIVGLMLSDRIVNFPFARAVADEHEDESRIILKLKRRIEHGAQGRAYAVIAAVHDHKLAIQTMRFAEGIVGMSDHLKMSFMRPGRHHGQLVFHIRFAQHALGHEPVQCDDPS